MFAYHGRVSGPLNAYNASETYIKPMNWHRFICQTVTQEETNRLSTDKITFMNGML